MGIVKRADSPYWWVNLERPGLPPLRESTRIPVAGATPFQTQENKRLAQQVYAIRMADLAKGRHQLATRERIRFDDYAAWYAQHISAHKRSVARERSMLRALVRYLGDFELTELDRGTVVEHFITPRKREVKAATVNRDVDLLKDMLQKAVPRYLEASPLIGMKRLRCKATPIRAITPEEERRLLQHADVELRAFLELGITSLMRLHDLVSLRWEYVHATHIDVIDPKVKPYKALLSKRAKRALAKLPRTSPWVFASFHDDGRRHRTGRRRHGGGTAPVNRAIRAFARLCAAAGVPHGRRAGGVTVHCMRHTGATRALARGYSVRAVMELGAWTDIRMVTRYTHPQDQELRGAVESI